MPRVSPLNMVIASLLVAIGYQVLDLDNSHFPWSAGYLILMAVACFAADLIFRSFLPDLKRIWIVELSFIIFVAILMFIIRSF